MVEQSVAEWYVVRTKPHQEGVAESSLLRGGVELLCPRIQERRVINRKVQQVLAPLFPGYLFTKCRVDQLRMVQYSKGVRGLVSFGRDPAVVSQEVIGELSKRLEGGVVVFRAPSFLRGDVVRIQEGPLCGLEAIFDRELSGQVRAILLMKMLVSQVRVVLDLKSVVNA